MANVSDGEDAWNICFEQKGIAVERPSLGRLSVTDKIRASQEESTLIALDQISQPIGARQGSDKNEHRTCRNALDFGGIRAKDGNFFEMYFAVHLDHAGVGPDLNVGPLFDLIDQILRHGAGERSAADEHDDAVRISGEIHGGLTGRVRATDDVDNFTLAGQCLGGATAVVDAGTLQSIDSGSVVAAPLH